MRITAAKSSRVTLRTILWASLGTFALVCLLRLAYFSYFYAAGSPGVLTFGATQITVELASNGTGTNWFSHQQNRVGEFGREHKFELRLPRGALGVQIAYDPVESVRRRLPNSVAALTELVRSGKPVEAFCAAEALAEKRPPAVSVLPVLLARAEKEPLLISSFSRIASASSAETTQVLLRGLSSPDALLRSESIRLLGEAGTNASAALPQLRTLFSNAPAQEQPGIALALWRIGGCSGDTVSALRQLFRESGDAALQGYIFQVASQFSAFAAELLPEMIELLKTNNNPSLLQPAVRLLARSRIDPPAAVSLLEGVLRRSESNRVFVNWFVRPAAIEALGEFGLPALPILTAIYQRTNSLEAARATGALARIMQNSEATPDVFFADLHSASPERIRLACEGLSRLGAKSSPAIPRLRELAQAQTRPTRVRAAATLISLNAFNPQLVAPLADCLRDPYPTAVFAASALATVVRTNTEIRDALEAHLASDSRLARQYESLRMFTIPPGQTLE